MLGIIFADPFLDLVINSKQPLHATIFFKKNYILKKDYQKALKKSTLSFFLNPVPFNTQSYQKQKGPRTSDHLYYIIKLGQRIYN